MSDVVTNGNPRQHRAAGSFPDGEKAATSPTGDPDASREEDRCGNVNDHSIKERVRCLLEETDPAFLADLISVFVSNGRELLQQIAQGLATFDAGVVERAAHSLKGASSTMGADRLAAVSRRVEEAAAQNRFSAVDLEEMQQLFESACRKLNEISGDLT